MEGFTQLNHGKAAKTKIVKESNQLQEEPRQHNYITLRRLKYKSQKFLHAREIN